MNEVMFNGNVFNAVKLFIKIFFVLVLLVVAGYLFRGKLYRSMFSYKSTGLQKNYSVKSDELRSVIESYVEGDYEYSVEELVQLSLEITADQLTFTEERGERDPNNLITVKKAHCEGYAAFCTATCNYLLKKFGFEKRWKARSHKAKLFFMGENINKYSKNAFFKHHDYVLIENKDMDESYPVDPTVYDYLAIDRITREAK